MPAPPKDGRNPTKTRDQAATSKKNVALSKAAVQADWQIKLKKDGPRIDRSLADLAKLAKAQAAQEQRDEAAKKTILATVKGKEEAQLAIAEHAKQIEETRKGHQRFLKMFEGTLKEIKTFKEVPVKGDLPKIPVNSLGMATVLPVLIATIAWWALVKKAR